MGLGLLIKLAGFSTKNPKTIISIVVVLVILAFGVHYKLLVGERDKLRVAEQGYKDAVTAFRAREATYEDDIRRERLAAGIAVAERDEARLSVEEFRNARQDAESIEWAADDIPIGELERLCVALPEMAGC